MEGNLGKEREEVGSSSAFTQFWVPPKGGGAGRGAIAAPPPLRKHQSIENPSSSSSKKAEPQWSDCHELKRRRTMSLCTGSEAEQVSMMLAARRRRASESCGGSNNNGRGGRRGRRHNTQRLRIIRNSQSAPNNNNEFLMGEHDAEIQDGVEMDELDFQFRDFSNAYDVQNDTRLDRMSKAELIYSNQVLEKRVEELEVRLEKLLHQHVGLNEEEGGMVPINTTSRAVDETQLLFDINKKSQAPPEEPYYGGERKKSVELLEKEMMRLSHENWELKQKIGKTQELGAQLSSTSATFSRPHTSTTSELHEQRVIKKDFEDKRGEGNNSIFGGASEYFYGSSNETGKRREWEGGSHLISTSKPTAPPTDYLVADYLRNRSGASPSSCAESTGFSPLSSSSSLPVVQPFH